MGADNDLGQSELRFGLARLMVEFSVFDSTDGQMRLGVSASSECFSNVDGRFSFLQVLIHFCQKLESVSCLVAKDTNSEIKT